MGKERKLLVVAEVGFDIAEGLVGWLGSKGYGLRAVDNAGDVVVSLFARNRFCVVLLNDAVGNGSVFETIQSVKSMFPHVPVIVTTARNDPHKETRYRKAGIFYYHIKSFGLDDLRTAISCAMRRASERSLPWLTEVA